MVCAVVAGVLPALKATGRGVQSGLQGVATGSRMRFGGVTSFLIVTEVAVALGGLAVGATLVYVLATTTSVESVVDPEEYLMARVAVPWTDFTSTDSAAVADFQRGVGEVQTAIQARLSAEPGVRGVAMADRVPEMEHPGIRIRLDGQEQGESAPTHRVRVASVGIGFFEGLGQPILSGRGFTTADLGGAREERTVVIVNTAFVEHVLGGREPVGRQLARAGSEESGPWYEIVGVVGHLGMYALTPSRNEGIYFPVAPGEINPVWLAIHVGSDPLGFIPSLRRITASPD